jgi:hypothetical protein
LIPLFLQHRLLLEDIQWMEQDDHSRRPFLQASKRTRVFASRTSFPEGPTIVWKAALGGSVNLHSYPPPSTATNSKFGFAEEYLRRRIQFKLHE